MRDVYCMFGYQSGLLLTVRGEGSAMRDDIGGRLSAMRSVHGVLGRDR